jgi:hypothetical protein
MNFSNQSLDEKLRIDQEIQEMKKHPIDYTDIPPLTEEERQTGRFGYENFLNKLPPDIVKEMVHRRLDEIKQAGYKLPEKT